MHINKSYKLIYLLSTIIFIGLLVGIIFYVKRDAKPELPLSAYPPAEQVAQLAVAFTDSEWDGVSVPDGQQCRNFGGSGASPSLLISDIPLQANAVLLAFGDLTYEPMLNGGHGVIGMSLANDTTSIVFPSVPAETTALPEGVYVEALHRSDRGDVGGYLPPCSGGIGNTYYVDVMAVYKAVSADDPSMLLGEARLILGKY